MEWKQGEEGRWGLLPPSLRQLASQLDPETREKVEEVRLRLGRPLSLVEGGREWSLPQWNTRLVEPEDLQWVLDKAGQGSVHTVLEQLRQGYLSVEGGHRIGVCGSVAVKDGTLVNFRQFSSLTLRFAHQMKGLAEPLLPQLQEEGRLLSTLIFAPPGGGKTTLLRDLIRCTSDGITLLPQRVGVADERGELCGMSQAMPQNDVGARTDIMDGCPKAQALLMLLRGMNPQVLAMDEITDPRDLSAMEEVAGCGVTLLATAHGSTPGEIRLRPLYRDLLASRIFRRYIWIDLDGERRRYRVMTAKELMGS